MVWLRDPIEYFFTQADDQVDCFFMDDGARSARYTPLYTNSGFYFIRNNMRTQFFMHRMLMAYDTVLAVRSHQHALIMLLLEPVWKSTSALGALSHFSAMTRPSWVGRAVRNRHRHAIEQGGASMAWRSTRRFNERAVKC